MWHLEKGIGISKKNLALEQKSGIEMAFWKNNINIHSKKIVKGGILTALKRFKILVFPY